MLRLRLIPAHAGKTLASHGYRTEWPAHPRSRGENRLDRPTSGPLWGSSPLTRGKQLVHFLRGHLLRLIPAHAGKTRVRTAPRGPPQAHPRSRGENFTPRLEQGQDLGSSPLTRGKPDLTAVVKADGRLIPAHAGKTQPERKPRPADAAHPRSRGENAYSARLFSNRAGSSPLTRGKPGHRERGSDENRLIPAHAGKTPCVSRPALGGLAHPRSRGENGTVPDSAIITGGSSPLTRGKPPMTRSRRRRRRLIPAHAGKTRPPTAAACPLEAHPRSRGENGERGAPGGRGLGSSPLTRGKHFLTCVFIAQIGQILESLELCASSESYSSQDAYATGAPQDQVRSIGLVPRSSRDAS